MTNEERKECCISACKIALTILVELHQSLKNEKNALVKALKIDDDEEIDDPELYNCLSDLDFSVKTTKDSAQELATIIRDLSDLHF